MVEDDKLCTHAITLKYHVPGINLSCEGCPKISVPASNRIVKIPTRYILMITPGLSYPDHN